METSKNQIVQHIRDGYYRPGFLYTHRQISHGETMRLENRKCVYPVTALQYNSSQSSQKGKDMKVRQLQELIEAILALTSKPEEVEVRIGIGDGVYPATGSMHGGNEDDPLPYILIEASDNS